MEKTLLLVTTGSHLYGLATLDSDVDQYRIYQYTHKNYRPKRQVKHKINADEDRVSASLDKFREYCIKGVPQCLEVLFSHSRHWLESSPQWEGHQQEIIQEVRKDLDWVLSTYRRTVMNFFAKDDFKKNRHGFRLMLNARDLKEKGIFDPTLSKDQIDLVNELANEPYEVRTEKYKDMLWEIFG